MGSSLTGPHLNRIGRVADGMKRRSGRTHPAPSAQPWPARRAPGRPSWTCRGSAAFAQDGRTTDAPAQDLGASGARSTGTLGPQRGVTGIEWWEKGGEGTLRAFDRARPGPGAGRDLRGACRAFR